MFYTYLHCKPDGTPFYVGKGSGRRAYDFRRGRNRHHKFVISKVGKENIKVFIFPCESEGEALRDEVQQIAQLRNEGYAIANIGEGGKINFTGAMLSLEARAKISAKSTGNKAGVGHRHTIEAKRKISRSLVGNSRASGQLNSRWWRDLTKPFSWE